MKIKLGVTLLACGCLLLGLSGCGRQREFKVPKGREIDQGGVESENGEKSSVAEGFPFPQDEGGKLLAQMLTPAAPEKSSQETYSEPMALPTPGVLDDPERLFVPVAPTGAGDVALPQTPPKTPALPLRPRLLPEDPPWTHGSHNPTPRPRPQLPDGPRVRVASPNVEQPLPLPILAQPVLDRVSLNDPTAAFSAKFILAPVLLERSAPVPFHRVNVPDPFEHGQTVRLRTPPPEDRTPMNK